MKKMYKFALLPLCVLALTSCASNGGLNHDEMVEYFKNNFSSETILSTYKSVTYNRVSTVKNEYASEIENSDVALEYLKEEYETPSSESEVTLASSNLDSFFLSETFIDKFEEVYSSDDIKPTYTISKKKIEGVVTYSKSLSSDVLSGLGVRDSALAAEVKVTAEPDGRITKVDGSMAANVDIDGDGNADVKFALTVNVSFTWNAK